MLDVNLIRENPEKVKKGVASKNVQPHIVDDFLIVDSEWRELMKKLDEARAKLNLFSKERKIEEAKAVKVEIKELEKRLPDLELKRDDFLNQLPNLPNEEWPVGKDEKENVVLREVGKRPEFDFPVKNYIQLGESLGIIDTERASEVAGSRFGYLMGGAAMLELALVNFGFQKLVKKGFQPIIPPVMIRPEMYKRIGRLAKGQEVERYHLADDDLFLVGSSEHTILPWYADRNTEEKEFPKRFVGFSTCFRREAGSYGKDTKGILRVHQFDKVEMVSFVKPEDSEKEHQLLLAVQEEMMQELKIPYRVVQICTGDMGWTDYAQYDIESWLPGENQYRETQSCSNMTDFSSRGANMKYKTASGSHYLHTLNATGLAIGRTIIAILENYQQKDGSVKVPEVLVPYVGSKEIVA